MNEVLDCVCFRMQPGAFNVGQEDPWGIQYALARMDAALDVKSDRNVFCTGYVVGLAGFAGYRDIILYVLLNGWPGIDEKREMLFILFVYICQAGRQLFKVVSNTR